ncbi:hypothetical protein HMPREF1991_02526 [Hoylesella loescheii DSM 19665 = JCM 12249 = ATCC 15930]|uniref:Uncharacterized protein n=1 Tax=Hoylesella loescheii DSM 19665 = JCM 12249 = ATCC 15930 TaxID=1122985 RepID=A0A069QFG7_HOYLO|nr:hypothetical protein HMPREF1991_02526 [Hoylesella loescheii DSM 19665 = JCM 12249 = ATCC 15930]
MPTVVRTLAMFKSHTTPLLTPYPTPPLAFIRLWGLFYALR